MVQTFPAGSESPFCGGQGVPKHRSREQKRTKVASKLSLPNMANLSPPTNRVHAGEADIQKIQRTYTASQVVESPSKQSQQRPKSSHCDFRESRQWARSNAEWIDNGHAHIQHTLDRRRASEDLLQSQPVPTTSAASEAKPNSHHRRISSEAEPLAQAHNLNCLSRSLSTGNWLNLRGNTANRKLHVHHHFGRFVRRITDTSNWACKDPTASLTELEEPKESDRVAQAAPKPKSRKHSIICVAKLNKKPGMDKVRPQKEAADGSRGESNEVDADAIINLNAAEDTPKRLEQIPALREQDIEGTKRRSAELWEVLSECHSDRHGNLLPEINTDAIGDFSGVPQQREQHAVSASTADIPPDIPGHDAEPRYASEQIWGLDSIESTTWKTPNLGSERSVPNTPMLLPQPGPRISSRHGRAISSRVRCLDASPLARRTGVSAPIRSPREESLDSVAKAVAQPGIATDIQQNLAAHLLKKSPVYSLSVFGAAPKKSTETLTTITIEALRNNTSGNPFILTDTDSVASKPSTRPTKLHSGFVSSGKAPGDAPNRPLPDLPEVPSPGSSERVRQDTGSRASSRSRISVRRLSTQPGVTRRTPSLISNNSSNGGLHMSSSPQSSPRRRSGSINKSGNVRSSSQKRSGDLAALKNAQDSNLASAEIIPGLISSDLSQSHDPIDLAQICEARDTTSRDQRIHNKRLRDVASARARRGKRELRRNHQSIQKDPAAEDFPPPPSSRPPSLASIDRQTSDPKSRPPTANIGAACLQSGTGLQTPRAEPAPLTLDAPPTVKHVQVSPTSRRTSRNRAVCPVPAPAPAPAPICTPVSISSVIETPKRRPLPKSKHRLVNLTSNATIPNSHSIHGTPTPPRSESSTPSSDEDGTGVVGATSTVNKTKAQKRLHLSTSDLAALIADMRAMREQLDGQMRQIKAQSKQIRTIEMQRLRMMEAVNALVAVVSEPIKSAVVSVSSSSRRSEKGGCALGGMNPYRLPEESYEAYGGPDKDSIASTINTVASARSASSGSRASDVTFITEPEPDPFVNGVDSVGVLGPEIVEFKMDFDRMQELIRLDKRKVEWREGKAKGARRNKSSGGAVGYLTIDA